MADEEQELGKVEHLATADRFCEIAKQIRKDTGDLRAWTIVLDFYAAVHWVRAYVRKKDPGAQLTSHTDVASFFRTMPELRKIKTPYDTLKQTSQLVRYYGRLEWSEADYRESEALAKRVCSWSVPKCKDA